MLVNVLGSIGTGLMWGWLLVLVGGRTPRKRPLVKVLALGLATLLVALQVLLLTHWFNLIIFLAAATLACLIHLAWRHSLRHRVMGSQ